MVFDSSNFEIVLVLLTKIVAFYIQAFIVQVQILCFQKPIQHIFLGFFGLQ